MEIPTFNHGGYKEQVKPEKHPTLCKIIDWFEFEGQIQPSILEKMPGNWEIWHVDTHCGHTSGFRQNELFRVLINLQDWEFGQLGLWGTKPVIQWKQGEAMWWNPDVPHMVANASRHIRYTFRLTGIPSAKTLEKAKLSKDIMKYR